MSTVTEAREATADPIDAAGSIADEVRFSLRGLPLLERGATMDSVGLADNLWAHSKVYSTGGENALHAHESEDHCFLVLQGEATFEFGDGSAFVARPFEGVFMKRGTRYRFHASEGENLVLFRVGAAVTKNPHDVDEQYRVPRELIGTRKGAAGQKLEGTDKKNGTAGEPTVFAPGAFFMAD